MALRKFLIPAVALASAALAQECSTDATLTIAGPSEASALASCTTYSGSVTFATDVAINQDSSGNSAVSVGTVEKITGNLTVTNVDALTQIEFNSLKAIGGFELGQLKLLSSLSLSQISSVDALNFTALPALQQLSFGDTGLTEAKSILISNTGLTSLQGLNNLESVETFNVNNNNQLQNISLSVTNIKFALDIEANDGYQSGLTTSFPQLQSAKNLTFRNCSEVLLPSLANVSDDIGFYGNTMESFYAPNLTTVGGLVFVDNTELTNISIPELTSVNGSYQIANNTQLKKVDGFQKLSTVGGALDFNGNFTDVELPALQRVSGAFNLQTSGEFDCSGFKKANDNKVIKGHYTCAGTVAKPGGEGTKPSGTSGSSSTKSGSADAVQIPPLPALFGGTSLLGALLQLLL